MIVDDSNIIRSRIERIQQVSGQFNVVGSATNGADAVELFKRVSPQVVTMDLTMPEMDGIECIRNLMKIDPDVMILVISALSDKATGIAALEEGAMGFLCKPFTEEELIESLEELVDV